MLKFATFDPSLHVTRLPLTYSLGDVSSIEDIFTPESCDIGLLQPPILPFQVETIACKDGSEIPGYLVEVSTVLLVAIREFLKGIVTLLQIRESANTETGRSRTVTHHHYAEVKRECMNRIGVRLMEVIKQDRRLGLYNLFWLVISQHVVTLLDQVIPAKGNKQTQYRIVMQPVLTQTFEQVLERVKLYLSKEDKQRRHYSPHIDDILTAHLGAAFNYEFSRAIMGDQLHLLFPQFSQHTVLEYAQAVFRGYNEKYHITYSDFMHIYSGMRSYIEGRIRKGDSVFCEILANVLKIPSQHIQHVPIETIVFHPTIISLFAEEIKQLPARTRKKTLFRSDTSQLSDVFGDESWEFAMNDYLSFAKDLRQSEIISFFRNRIMFVRKASTSISPPGGLGRQEPVQGTTSGIADKISYQFDKGRIVNDLRRVTLIFLDLRGFTEVSASDITDQELKEHLYAFFDPAVNIINHFGGTIKNYAGDGIFAAFGADKNHALNAIRAAIEIQRFFTMLKDEGKMPFKGMGIGIHTGLVEEAYFFFDPHSAGFNTVIGLAANLVGRLSSGKAEKKKRLDRQTASSVLESLMASPNLDISLISNIEDMLFQAVDAFRRKPPTERWRRHEELTVKVEQGILNNQGIAISGVENGTFDKIRSSVDLKEIELHRRIHYTFFDNLLREQIVFIKAGDASFKGIDTGVEGKIPVWGVYLTSELPNAFAPLS